MDTTPMPLCMAAAQAPAHAGDLARNLQIHLAFVQAAARRGVQVLVFPELSLTGYELGLLPRHVLGANHAIFVPLRQAARSHGMALVVGAPAEAEAGSDLPAIGAWVLTAEGQARLYRKRHLHGSETAFASAGSQDAPVHTLADVPVAMAICADITHPEHAQAAQGAGAALYAAGALISRQGYGPESALMQGYAARHGMAVLLANYSGSSGGYASAGGSAIWAPGGAMVVAAPDDAPSLVWAQCGEHGWAGGVEPVALSV